MGLLEFATSEAVAQSSANDTPQNILNVAATAEVLATTVNTVGAERLGDFDRDREIDLSRGGKLDGITTRNIRAAARHELIHYDVLTSLGAKPLTKKIWVPDVVFGRGGFYEFDDVSKRTPNPFPVDARRVS